MSATEFKRAAAKAAIAYVPDGAIIGVGTGSTADCFIDELIAIRDRIEATVASSEVSANRLESGGVRVISLNSVNELPVYVDGADEITRRLHMIKGGGGALTREKIVAAVAKCFVCIADDSKLVDVLGAFPLPVEVIPMARTHVTKELLQLGGRVNLREGFTTDNGNIILDVHDLEVRNPDELETEINQITGVVTNGLFARRGADIALIAGKQGVTTLKNPKG